MKNKFLLFLSVVFLGIGQIWGQTEILTINRSHFPTGNGYVASTWTATASTGEAITGQSNLYLNTAAHMQIGGTQLPHPYNSVEIPGAITKIQITMPGSGSLRQWTPRVSESNVLTSASGGTSLTPQTFASNSGTLTWDLDASDNYKFFYLQAGGNTNIASITIEYEVATSCEDSNLTFTDTTVNKDLLDPSFTETATSFNATTAITYESSDEAVATVNATTGEVSLVGVGTATITASQEAGEHSGVDYCAGTATYDVVVTTSAPLLTVSTNSASFSGFAGGAVATEDVLVEGLNLIGDIALALSGDTNFSINPTSLSSTGGEVTINYTPSASPATHSATLTVSNGALSEVIALSGVTNEVPAGPWEDFEIGSKGSYIAGTVVATAGEWYMDNALLGTLANDRKNGLQSVRIQNTGFIHTNFNITTGVGIVKVSHARYGSDSSSSWKLLASTDNGATWTAYESSIVNTTLTTLSEETFTLNLTGNVRLRIEKQSGGGQRLNIDDIYITPYSAAPQAPVITSPLTHSSEYGAAATYTITADYLPTSFNATGLPAGLSINTSTGEISGTVTADVGNYNINISATNDEGTDTETLVWTVTPKALTATLSVENKVYDGTTTATISSSPTPTLSGIVGSDDVSLSGTPTATFDNKNTGTNKTVTISGYSLSGTKAGNYTLTTPTATANITAKSLTVSGATAQDKDYDGSNTATITGSTLEGVINPDNVTVSGGGTFASPNAGTGISVTANLTLGGADAGNYTLIQPSGLVANINKVAPEISPTIITLNVGGTYSLPGGISSDSDGNMTFSMVDNAHATLSGNIINGISIGANTLTISIAQGTNHTATTASITVNVTDFIFLDGDVRPLYDGVDFSHDNAWEIYNSATNTWTTRNASLQNTKPTGRILIDKQNIGAGGNNSNTYLNDIIILSGGELFIRDVAPNYDYTTWSYFLSLNKNLTVQANGKLIVEGDIRLGTNILTIEKDGELILDNPKMRNDNGIWAGTENFMDGSIVTIKDWEWDASSSVSSLIQTGAPGISNNPNGYKFGNLIIDAELYEHWTLIGSTNYPNLPLCYGNLEIYNTSEDWFIAATSNNSSSFVVNGNLIIYDGWFNFGTTYTGNNDFINHYTINGSLINISDDNFKLHHVEAGSSTPSGSVTIKGNIEIGEDVIISNDGNKKILLETGNDEDPKFIDIASNVVRTDIDINSGYRILKKDLVLGTNSKVTVNNNSTLNFGFDTSGTNPLAIRRFNNNATQTGQSFELKNGGILKITSPDGITSGGTYTGNVQVGSSNSNRIFGGGATYHYIGKTNQSTGNGLPDGITGKLIIELETDDSNENLEFTSTGTNTFGTIDGVNGILEIRKGKVIDQPNSGFRNYNGTTNENEDGESDPQRGDIIMTGGRYVVSGGGTKPSLSGSYTLTDGTVEFAGTANTKIRVKPLYHNMDVSGSNVTAGGKNLIVNNLTKVIGTGKLTIPETDDSATPYVLTARKGIQVASGATALFENNANLMQDEDAVNIGDITVERFVQDMNNVLPDHMDYVYWSSPVTGQGIHDGTNSIFSPGTPKNRNYQYHEPTDYFVPTPDQTFTPGKGYAIRAETGPNPDNNNENFENGYDKTYTFTGIANNGLVSIPIQKSPDNPEGVEHGYNLVGNPYPSNIDADVLFDLNETQIEPVIYLWTNNITQPYQPGSSYNGESYATYNRVGGVSAGENADPAGSGWSMNEEPNGIIKVGQGFIIKAKEGANSLQFQNMAGTTPLRITDQGFFFQRNLSQKDRFWLEQKSPLGMINSTLVGYVLGATNEFEKDYDAPMLTETSDAIYTVMDSIKLSIQGRSFPLELTDVVPLGLNHFEAGVYTIGIRKVDGIFNQQSIYLRDKQKEIVHNLSLDGEYVYETNAGELTDRFEIIFQEDEVMSTSDLLDNPIKIYHTDQSIVIESEKEKILSVEVYDLNGRKVHSKDRINSNLYQIRKTSLATQVFVVKVLTDGGKVETRKIINQ